MLHKLFKQGAAIPDLTIQDKIFQKKNSNSFKFIHYLYQTIKPFIDKPKIERIESKIREKYKMGIAKKVKTAHTFNT